MLTLKEYANKISRLQSTRKMTKTMKMVSANRLRRTQDARRRATAYLDPLLDVARRSIEGAADPVDYPLLGRRGKQARCLLIVVTSDRGLCGSLNHAVNRQAETWMKATATDGVEVEVLCLGRRGHLYFKDRVQVARFEEGMTSRPRWSDSVRLAGELEQGFLSGRYREIWIAHSVPKTSTSSTPTMSRWLPLVLEAPASKPGGPKRPALPLMEPSQPSLGRRLLPQVAMARFHEILLGHAVAEHGARMMSMENATSNADKLIDSYTTQKNMARQASITRELIEIVAGAEALR